MIYTQLSGSTLVHGSIKLLSKVKSKWLNSLVPKLEQININQLIGIIDAKKNKEEIKEEITAKENISEKIENAKMRYLKRRKIDI